MVIGIRARPYIYLARLRLHVQFAYRIEAYAGVFSSIIPLISVIFLWKAVFRGGAVVEGVTEHQMLTYAILATVLKDVFYFNVQDNILKGVRNGDIALDLARPINPALRYLAEDIALSAATFLRRMLPILLATCVILPPPFPASLPAALLSLVSAFLSFIILWSLSALTGLATFWLIDFGNLGMVKDALVRMLSGSIVPIWFFPDWYRRISVFLPFEHSYQTMLGIYVGKTGVAEALVPLCCQVFWALFLAVCVRQTWIRATKNLLIQGG